MTGRRDTPAGPCEGPSPWPVVAGIMLVLFVARLGLAARFDLFADEALYVWILERMPLTFSPHPPGTPWLAGLGMNLLGRNEVGVRLMSLVFTSALFVPVFLLARDLGGRRFALWSVVGIAAVPEYFGFGIVATPDGTQLFVWCLALFLTHRALFTGGMGWWLAAGATLGVGLYVKYILVLYYPALALVLLVSPSHRRHLRTAGPYASAALAAALFAPGFFTSQILSNWEALRYHLSERQDFRWPTLESILNYHGGHLLYLSPFVYVGCLVAMIWCAVQIRKSRGSDSTALFLGAFSLVPYLFFALIAMFTARRLSREQWDAMAYVTAILAGVAMVRRVMARPESARRRPQARRWALLAAGTGWLTTAGLLVEGYTGLFSGLSGATPPFKTLLGFERAAAAIDRHAADTPSPDKTFVLGNSFVEALTYKFYTRRNHAVYAMDNSSNTRFGVQHLLNRAEVGQHFLSRETGHHAIFVDEDDNERKIRQGRPSRRRAKLDEWFEQVEPLPPVDVELGGRIVKRFHLYRCWRLRPQPTHP
ncbi:MAG: glycosyltransferase family 39 protein [Candidatus Sumerlaeaceae bacterium]|nr:glycosyltransferase family 39 protein [Candidatus Sumerlaeaceae bacterium]